MCLWGQLINLQLQFLPTDYYNDFLNHLNQCETKIINSKNRLVCFYDLLVIDKCGAPFCTSITRPTECGSNMIINMCRKRSDVISFKKAIENLKTLTTVKIKEIFKSLNILNRFLIVPTVCLKDLDQQQHPAKQNCSSPPNSSCSKPQAEITSTLCPAAVTTVHCIHPLHPLRVPHEERSSYTAFHFLSLISSEKWMNVGCRTDVPARMYGKWNGRQHLSRQLSPSALTPTWSPPFSAD